MALAFTAANDLAWAGGANAIASALPVTYFGWFKQTNNAADAFPFGGSVGGSLGSYYSVFDVKNNNTSLAIYGWPGNGNSVSRSGNSLNSWQPAMVVFASNLIKVYYTSSDVSGSSAAPSNNSSYIGNNTSFNIGFLNTVGELAEVHIWRAALGDTEWASLKGGALPETIGSGYLDGWTLQNAGDYTSIGGSRVLTPTGAGLGQTTHPITRVPPAVVSGGITLDDINPAGTLVSLPSTLSGGVTLDDIVAAGSLGAAPGTITVSGLRNASKQLMVNLNLDHLMVIRIADRQVLLSLANQALDGNGDLVRSNVALAPGTLVMVLGFDSSGANSFRRAVTVT